MVETTIKLVSQIKFCKLVIIINILKIHCTKNPVFKNIKLEGKNLSHKDSKGQFQKLNIKFKYSFYACEFVTLV